MKFFLKKCLNRSFLAFFDPFKNIAFIHLVRVTLHYQLGLHLFRILQFISYPKNQENCHLLFLETLDFNLSDLAVPSSQKSLLINVLNTVVLYMALFFVGYFLFLASFFAFSVFNLCLYIFHLNGLHFSVHFIFICVFFIEIFIVVFITLHYCLYCLDFSHFF